MPRFLYFISKSDSFQNEAVRTDWRWCRPI